MINIHQIRYTILTGLCLGLALASAWILQKEMRSGPAFSIQADQKTLTICLHNMTKVTTRLLPLNLRRDVFDQCAIEAFRITNTAPTNAFSWYVAAYATAGYDDGIFNKAMANSFRFAPNSLWIAELRTGINTANYAQLSRPNQQQYLNDLSLLFYHQRGIEQLARLHLRYANFQQIFIPILAKQTLENQQKFLRELTRYTAFNAT